MEYLRSLRIATWLGWQIESNWTEPWLFAIYVFIKPLAGSLLLVLMVVAARNGGVPVADEFFSFVYVGNACYMLVGAVTFGMTWAVISDREHFGMLKYIAISPVRMRSYLIGRGVSRAAQGALGAVLSLTVGAFCFPRLRDALTAEGADPLGLVYFLVIGTAMLVVLGLILAGAVLNMAKHGMFLSEGVAGMLYLVSGVIFPLDVLPGYLQVVGLCLPTTYWLEGMRRSLLGVEQLNAMRSEMLHRMAGSEAAPVLNGWSSAQLAAALAVSTFVLAVVAHYFFAWCERRAWRLGKYDERSGW
jgi:ABC-2 type transport system permease protein